MNTTHPQPRARRARRSFVILTLVASALLADLHAQTSTVTIDAANVVRDVPAGLGGVCTDSKFWDSASPGYGTDYKLARIGLSRIRGYPYDSAAGVGTLAEVDTKVAQLINAGAAPLFIQSIESAANNPAFHNALLRLDGTPYPAGDTTPINQRVATNITYLVNRYKSPPFNLATQYWEIGNEPDLANVNYRVATPQEYVDFFSLAHNRLVASGVRGNVLLAGPVVSWEYGFGDYRDQIMDAFLPACKDQVDIVTRHVYAYLYDWEGVANTAYNQLNHTVEMVHFDHTVGTTRGEKALLNKMTASGVPATVGTGITELNLANGGYNHSIVQGLWFLIGDHFTRYNPRSLVTTGFQFDRYNHSLAYYKADKTRSFPYWASYIQGVLTGDRMLAQTSSNSHVVVTASKDDSYLYVRLINRHDTATYTANVTINNAPPVTAPTRFDFTATATPDTGTATALGTTFSHVLPPLTAAVFRYPRTDAPTPPTPPADPSDILLTTDFATAPAGLLVYANPSNPSGTPATNPANFIPLVTAGDLKLTTTTGYLATAAVFNGQPLPSAKNRVQARFCFQVQQNYADGFVFGAYSANPGAQGDYGQALGYYGQNNRIWGVKIDNNPDQIAIMGATTNNIVDGWSTQPLAVYAGQDMYMIVDYDGDAGTVRARLYQGTSEAGILKADLVNRVGNPAVLPAGTVFGFAGGTSNFSQNTLIRNLTITTDGPAWLNADVGAVAAAGSTSVSGGVFTVTGSGQYIWNATDEFQYAYQQVTGDCTITARILTQQNTHANAPAGVMIRESLATGSKHALMHATPSSGLQFIHRNSTNGSYSVPVTVSGAAPSWLKLVRTGQTFTAYTSADGATWTTVGAYTYSGANTFSTGPVYVGLAVSSRVDGTLCTATFDNVTVTTP